MEQNNKVAIRFSPKALTMRKRIMSAIRLLFGIDIILLGTVDEKKPHEQKTTK